MTDLLDAPHVDFTVVESPKPTWQSSETKNLFQKWGLSAISLKTFRFSRPFTAAHRLSFVEDFFNSSVVRETISLADRKGEMFAPASLWGTTPFKLEPADIAPFPCTVTSMKFFRRLEEGNGDTVVKGGEPVKCFDVVSSTGEVLSDELRILFAVPDESRFADLYTDPERGELIFRLMKMLVVGGSVCQFEDKFDVYRDITRKLYREIVSVGKPESEIVPLTTCIAVRRVGPSAALFPNPSRENNVAFLLIAPHRMEVTFLYSAFVDTW